MLSPRRRQLLEHLHRLLPQWVQLHQLHHVRSQLRDMYERFKVCDMRHRVYG